MNKNKGFIGIGLIIAIVLGIVVVGGGAYYLGTKKNTKVVENTSVTNPIEENNSHEVPTGPYGDETNYVAPKPVVNNPASPQVSTGCTSNSIPSIKVLSPNGGEIYKAGDKIIVKWKSCNNPHNPKQVIVSLDDPAGFRYYLSGNHLDNVGTADTGILTTTLPNVGYVSTNSGSPINFKPGNNFTVMVSAWPQEYEPIWDFSDTSFTINSETISSNIIKQTDCGVSFYKTSDWSVISNTSNETKLDILPNDHTGFSGIDIKCVLGNSITDTDAKFGNITYYYNSSSQKWMVSAPNERDGGTLPAVEATPLFTVNGLPVFRGTGRWLTYIIPTSPSSILSLNEGDTEGGYTQTLTNLVKTLKKL